MTQSNPISGFINIKMIKQNYKKFPKSKVGNSFSLKFPESHIRGWERSTYLKREAIKKIVVPDSVVFVK